MINHKFKLPHNALVNKFIAKTKLYERATLSSKIQNEFIKKINKITWKYKLAEDTIGISKTDSVTEIQVFEIELKEQVIPENVLKVIDKAIPYQILYQFVYKDNTAYGITLKGPILKTMTEKESASTRNYYFSQWNEDLNFDFTGIDLEKVYQKLIKAFINNEAKNQSDFAAIIDADDKIKRLGKEITTLGSKIRKEKQFNRKVELNKFLLERQQQLKIIKGNL
ncbi:MAG: DUF4391 domain-containing protein [Deltaproteobacteria bacterium]|nr:DUF4391 domain-containing protein [Deltaproteobacteria bacterium]